MLDQTRLLLDFGLVVLIWLVQLVIYPSFLHYESKNLIPWHNTYTMRITYVVLPLMLGQLMVAALQILQQPNWYTILSIVLIISLWLSTFLQFVPLHNQVSTGNTDPTILQQLVQRNWLRTFLWSLLFILSALQVFRT